MTLHFFSWSHTREAIFREKSAKKIGLGPIGFLFLLFTLQGSWEIFSVLFSRWKRITAVKEAFFPPILPVAFFCTLTRFFFLFCRNAKPLFVFLLLLLVQTQIELSDLRSMEAVQASMKRIFASLSSFSFRAGGQDNISMSPLERLKPFIGSA